MLCVCLTCNRSGDGPSRQEVFDNEIAAVKSDLIKAVHTAFDAVPGDQPMLSNDGMERVATAQCERQGGI